MDLLKLLNDSQPQPQNLAPSGVQQGLGNLGNNLQHPMNMVNSVKNSFWQPKPQFSVQDLIHIPKLIGLINSATAQNDRYGDWTMSLKDQKQYLQLQQKDQPFIPTSFQRNGAPTLFRA